MTRHFGASEAFKWWKALERLKKQCPTFDEFHEVWVWDLVTGELEVRVAGKR